MENEGSELSESETAITRAFELDKRMENVMYGLAWSIIMFNNMSFLQDNYLSISMLLFVSWYGTVWSGKWRNDSGHIMGMMFPPMLVLMCSNNHEFFYKSIQLSISHCLPFPFDILYWPSGGWHLLQHVMLYFAGRCMPNTFTWGEALLISHGFTIVVMWMLNGNWMNETSQVMQVVVIGVSTSLLVALPLVPFFAVHGNVTTKERNRVCTMSMSNTLQVAVVVVCTAVGGGMVLAAVVAQNPLIWLLSFICDPTAEYRLPLLVYWIVLLSWSLGTSRFEEWGKRYHWKKIVVRKCFHLLAVLLFVPAAAFDVSPIL